MKKLIVTVSAASLIFASLAPTAFGATKSFVDIEKSYAKDAIIELQAMGILNGMDDTHYGPKGTLTRAQFTAIIVRTLGLDASATVSSFTDVKGWAVGAIEAAAKAGIIEGIGNGVFAPNASLTRQEAAAILVRALQLKGELDEAGAITFKDAGQISEWAKPFIALAQHYGLIKGNPDNTFDPKGKTTREMAAMLGMNFLAALDDVKPEQAPVTPPVDPKPEDTTTPPVVTPPYSGGYYIPPTTEPPVTEPPTTEPPTTEPPVTEPPVTEPPVTEPPVTEPPVTEPPVTEPPAEVDIIVPVIALIGEPVVNVVYSTYYVDAGVTATDNKDGDITDNVVKTIYGPDEAPVEAINTTVIGAVYTVHYNVSDAAGNPAVEVIRTVNVVEEVVETPVDDIIPVIALEGKTVVDVVYGDTYVEEGYTAIDNKDGDITTNVVATVYGPDASPLEAIDTTLPGTYTVKYNVTDAAGNKAVEVIRTVKVAEEVIIPTVVSNVYLTPNGFESTVLSFQIDKELDLASGNLEIKFLDINGDEVAGANDLPVVKDRTWSGFLNSADGTVKYSVGTGEDADESYTNILPANSVLTTLVTSAYGYAGSDWYNAIATIVVTATDYKDQVTTASVNMPTINPEVYVTAQDFGKNVPDVTYAVYGSYNLGFQIHLDKLEYSSIATVTGTVYDGDTVIGKVSANTQDRIDKYEAADKLYSEDGEADGQLSFDFTNAATLEHEGIEGNQTSYLEYLVLLDNDYFSGDKLPTSAELTIVTKAGISITVRYMYN